MNMPQPWREVFLPALAVSLLVGATVYAASALYGARGGALLQRLDGSVGETLMHQGLRLERAGRYGAAIDVYERALGARFQGAQNRAHTLKSLGHCYAKEGRDAEAAARFAEAEASPHWALVWYRYYIGVVTGADALAVATSWRDAALAAGNTALAAEACLALGLAHGALGDDDAAERAFAEGATLAPGSENDCALAHHLALRGQDTEARTRALDCLAQGATGIPAAQARRLLHH